MTFAIGLIVGLCVGASLGAAIMGFMLAGKISDLQDQVDTCETSRLQP